MGGFRPWSWSLSAVPWTRSHSQTRTAAGTLSIPASQTTATIPVTVKDNPANTGGRSVVVRLKWPNGAWLGAVAQHPLSIQPPSANQAPSASPKQVTTAEDTALAITLAGSDADGTIAGYTITAVPTNGTLTGSGANRTYTPASNFTGTDRFTVTDDRGAISAPAAVDITVGAVNDGAHGRPHRAGRGKHGHPARQRVPAGDRGGR